MSLPYLNSVENTFNWFTEAFPEPKSKNFHTQLGVHCEEFREMFLEVTPNDIDTLLLLEKAKEAVHALANHLKASDKVVYIKEQNRVNFLDSLCDQYVTATGVAYLSKFNFIGATNEVNLSNWSKFVNGKAIFDQNLKIAKGPDYFKANLEPFVLPIN